MITRLIHDLFHIISTASRNDTWADMEKCHVLSSTYFSPNIYIYWYTLSDNLSVLKTYNTAIVWVKKKKLETEDNVYFHCVSKCIICWVNGISQEQNITPHARYWWCCFQIKDLILCIQKLNLNFPVQDTTPRTTVEHCCLQLKTPYRDETLSKFPFLSVLIHF
jgi:hypothetical protein